jgi:hypothetical protein
MVVAESAASKAVRRRLKLVASVVFTEVALAAVWSNAKNLRAFAVSVYVTFD